ncbi:MAG: carbohydrate-binding module family 14 protein [Pyrinomonadaceae bacterium]|nr:carbohydrate-binding module family 14 protein [Pyrinomonadaceae bacterium]
MAIDLNNIEESYEMKAFKKEIADFSKASEKFIANAVSEANAIRRAKSLTSRLKAALAYSSGRQCPKGTVWDPETKTCI